MKLKISLNSLYFTFILVSNLFSWEYTENGFELFSLSGDAITHSMGGVAHIESMSLVNLYTLNESHKKGKSLFTYGKLYLDIIDYFQFSYILRNTKKSKIGVSLLNKYIDNIPNTQNAWEDLGSYISQDEIDYSEITSYKDQQISVILLLSYSHSLADIAFKLKPIYTSILTDKAYGISADFSLGAINIGKLKFGLSVNDIISLYTWSTGKTYSIYPTLRTLAGYTFNNQSLYSEMLFCTNIASIPNRYIYKFGYEININNNSAFRLGYSNNKSLSIGFEVKSKKISYSYSYCPNLNDIILGHDHQFSILLESKKKN